MTTNASPSALPHDSAQQRVSQNIVQLLALRGASRAALARHLRLDAAGVSRRILGGVTWNLEEVQEAAVFVQVPWPWLYLELPELMAKVSSTGGGDGGGLTAGRVTPRYADSTGRSSGFRVAPRSVTPGRQLAAA